MRKVAAHRVIASDRNIEMGIVELEGGVVVGYYPFTAEQAMTEWLGGTIEIRMVRGRQLAFHEGIQLI
ncbi:hypothetical protein JCM15908A_01240 [Prevotella dentasini JCM 15908]